MQIRARLTLLFLLLAAGILAAVLLGVYWLFQKNTETTFYNGLQEKVELTIHTALVNEKDLAPLPNNWLAPEGDTLPYIDNVSIFDNAYTRVFSIRPDAVPITPVELQAIYQQGESRFNHFNLRALGVKAVSPTGNQYVVIAEGYCDPGMVIQLRNILLLSFFAGIFLVAFTGWYYAGKALQPVSQIVGEVEDIQPSDLSRRVPTGNNKDELARMAQTFNRLLDRVERAFQMQRMFISNVSHELKNPLTAIRAQLDVALQRERTVEYYQKALQSVLDDVEGLGETEQKLLQLAKVYSTPQHITLAPTRLDELLWLALEHFKKQYPHYHSSLKLVNLPEREEQLLVQANEALLRLAILNLMSNACKYSPDSSVLVRAIIGPGHRHEIEVCNNGPSIPEEEKSLIFEPFYRSPKHLKVKGTGIGLSLVKSILQLHQIELAVESPAQGGSIFRLTFP